MRAWQVERRKRTRHLIELGGLVVKAGVVDLTGDDRVMIYGALLWIAEKLKSDQGERARALWTAKGEAVVRRQPGNEHTHRSLMRDDGTLAEHYITLCRLRARRRSSASPNQRTISKPS